MKRGGPSHPKTQRLALALDVPLYAAVGILEMLWHFTAQYAPAGDLGKFTDAELETHIRWQGVAGALVPALEAAGFVDRHPTHRLVVHDWHEHADQAVQRVLSRRATTFVTIEKPKRKASSRRLASELVSASLARGNGNGNGLAEGERERETQPPRSPRELTEAFESRFWPAYPKRNGRRDGKSEALTAWLKLAPDLELEARMLRALASYGKATEYPVDAVRWLKHRRWEDEPDAMRPVVPVVTPLQLSPRVQALIARQEVARG